MALNDSEHLSLNFDLESNEKSFNISIYNSPNKFKIVSKEKKNNYTYEALLSLEQLQTMNKYIKMSLSNIIELCNKKKFSIKNFNEEEMIISLDLPLISSNIMNITLKRKNKNEEKNININDKDKKIEELNSQINEMQLIIKEKSDKISELQNIVEELDKRIKKVENKDNQNDIIHKLQLQVSILEKNIFITENSILNNSNIFERNDEIELLCSKIAPKGKATLFLIYNKTQPDNKLRSSYIGITDILILVKTQKYKRFGAYAHECFEENEFSKKDSKAFLVNLDSSRIYESKNLDRTIWNNESDSIDFGRGTDLRIYYNFNCNENYTYQSNNFDYGTYDTFALNGEKYFFVTNLEIYKVIIRE